MFATQRQPEADADLLLQAPPSRRRLRHILRRLKLLCLVPAIARRRRDLLTDTLEQLDLCVSQCFAVEERLGIFGDLVPSSDSLRARAAALLVQRQRLQAEIGKLAGGAANDDVYTTAQAAEALVRQLQDNQYQVDQFMLDCLEHEVDSCCAIAEQARGR